MPAGYPAVFDELYTPEPNTGCWLWFGARNRNGYGVIHHGLAHRFAFIRFVGAIPRGSIVRHKCDTPACVNPDHLELGTQADNLRDIVKRGRHWGQKNPEAASKWGRLYGARPKAIGEKNPKAKLTSKEVLEIRASTDSAPGLAEKYGVSRNAIYYIRSRATWSHI